MVSLFECTIFDVIDDEASMMINDTLACGKDIVGLFILVYPLKTVDTIGNCQRPVFSLGVSQHYA